MNKIDNYFYALFFCCLSLGTSAQNKTVFDGLSWKPPYKLELDGWGVERFLIPIDFAPSIKYTGVEDIRFTKGWSDENSPDYWSYAFLWLLDNCPVQNVAVIQKNLNAYYDGLVGRNVVKRMIPKEIIFKTQTKLGITKTESGDLQTYAGIIHILDYMAQKPMVLHVKVHVKKCPGSTKIIIF